MSGIWFMRPNPESLNGIHKSTACESLGIRLTEVGDDFIRGTMPVDARTVQPFGLLHGGASATLAETLGSIAAAAMVNPEESTSVGTSLTANHIRSATSGVVTGTARPLHLGRTGHLWEIKITNSDGKTICFAQLTTRVIPLARVSQ